MVALIPPIRLGSAADAAALVELINMAGEGLPDHFWRKMAAPGQHHRDFGRQRMAARTESGEVYVVDDGAGAVATLIGYPIPAAPEPVTDDAPAIIRPLQQLETLAPASWYVNVLAAFPDQRGRGHGSRLLALAEALAREAGLAATSVIVANANAGALRLYRRVGYAETARRPVATNGWHCDSTDWVLLTKPL